MSFVFQQWHLLFLILSTVWPDHFIIFFEFLVAQNVAFGDFLKKWSDNTVIKVIEMTQKNETSFVSTF